MPKFAVGDVVRVLGNNGQGGWYPGPELGNFVGRVGVVTEVRPWDNGRGIKIDAFSKGWWFDSEQCEIAQIQVGDRVITERFGPDRYYGFVPEEMDKLVGKVGKVIQVSPGGYRVDHDGDDWYWAKDAVKFALDGDVPVAPQQAAVEAPKALPEPVKKAKNPAIIKNLRSALNRKVRESGGPGTASYAVQFKDGRVRWQVQDACHARIGICDYADKGRKASDIVKVATCVAGHYKELTTQKEKDNYKRFVDYIINRSPFADCFIPTKVPVRYSVEMNLKRSVNNIAAAAIALREGSEEYGGKVSTFIWLLGQGVSEDAAWVASRFFTSANGKEGDKYSFQATRGHTTIYATGDADKFFKVFKDGMYLNDKPYTEYASRYKVAACFGAGDNDDYACGPKSLGKFLKEQSGYTVQGTGWARAEYATGEGVIKAAKWIDEEIAKARAA